jgi:predicted PurR-regulated permease PerM
MTASSPRHIGIVQITAAVLLVVIIGWLIVIGKSLLLPIVIGIIAVYILTASADAAAKLPVIGGLGQKTRRWIVGLAFMVILVFLIDLVATNAKAISDAAPSYDANLTAKLEQIASLVGMKKVPTLDNLFAQLQNQIDMSTLISSTLARLTGTGTFIVTAFLYAAFLLSDWNDLPNKTRLALGNEARAKATLETARKINARIGGYLASKTLINVILGALSYVVMLFLGIEYAMFWALMIAILNYIPYFGSILGVVFPVALAMVQFESWSQPMIAFVALMAAQLFVGNVLEPKMLGKSVNMSPFVFLIALAFWMQVWGLTGAILAIPLTSMVMIILAEIPQPRPIAVMMSGDGAV